MVEELEFRKVKAKGWRGGFKNLIIAEFARWKTNMWWINGIVWIIVINGMLGAAVGVIRFRLEAALGLYSGFGGLFTSVAAVIFAQDVIVGEKKSGTAAWVLSKPVSRTAFILSKLIGNFFSCFITMIFVPGIIAYLEISIIRGTWLSFPRFLGAMGVLTLHQLFYLTMTLMIGTFSKNLIPVIGIPIGYLFLQNYPAQLFPPLIHITPWFLLLPRVNTELPIISAIILGEPLLSVGPIIVVAVCPTIFVILAIWRFNKEEF